MAAARKRAAKRGRKWVRRVRTVSTFPPEGLFTRDAATIARVMATRRVSPGGLGSAIRMVQLVINRGGKGLTASRRRTLERAKRLLQDAAARERAAERIRAEASRRRRRAQRRRSRQSRQRRASGMPIATKTPMSTRTRKSVPDSAQSRPSLSHAPAERASQREQMRHTRVETARRAALERGKLAEGQLRPRIAARDNTQWRHSGRRVISTRARRRSR